MQEKYTSFCKEMLPIVPTALSMSQHGSEFCVLQYFFQMKSRCKFPDDIFAGPKHVEIIEWCLCLPEYFYFIISVMSFYLAVCPHVAAGEQFIVCSGMLLIFCLFLLILVKKSYSLTDFCTKTQKEYLCLCYEPKF